VSALPKNEVWIGLVEVRKYPDCEILAGKPGAFTNIITWASSNEEFRQKVVQLAMSLRLFVVGIEGAEPLAQRKQKFSIDPELEALEEQASLNPNAILYGTFHTYLRDEA
jgi:hypothetical protein